jgi:membrane protease YdiL (CAAX protease family)
VWITALLFGATHVLKHNVGGALIQAAFATAFGFMLGAVRARGGSIFPLIVWSRLPTEAAARRTSTLTQQRV